MGKPTELTKNAHAVGLQVHTWTLRVENMFLPDSLKVDPKNDSTLRGNGIGEMKEYILAGVDAFFTDSPDYGRFAVDTFALMY
jgi:glycerophosphoryl diester phosphodiesterase